MRSSSFCPRSLTPLTALGAVSPASGGTGRVESDPLNGVWHPLRVRADEWIEITDLLVEAGPGGERIRVSRDAVMDTCRAHGDRWAERIVDQMPTVDGWLDDAYVDRLMVTVHCEIQRLSEEFRHGARVWEQLEPILSALRRLGFPPPYRVVDVGCGTGYVIRWLADHCKETDVEFVGVDLNPALIDAARSLADLEALGCRFEVADAFALDEPATIMISTGVMHHFRGVDLDRFFVAHENGSAVAFVHIDFQPSPIAPFGAWLFHRTRMRLALARHDGIRSAQRAHPPRVLARTAARNAPGFETWVMGRHVRLTPLPCVLTTLIGARRDLSAELLGILGSRAKRLERLA